LVRTAISVAAGTVIEVPLCAEPGVAGLELAAVVEEAVAVSLPKSMLWISLVLNVRSIPAPSRITTVSPVAETSVPEICAPFFNVSVAPDAKLTANRTVMQIASENLFTSFLRSWLSDSQSNPLLV
jgi:hypothetical protein